MPKTFLPAVPVRAALCDLKSKTASVGSEPPTWDRILTVSEHEGALDPSRAIVIGDRGTGKSFWTGALQDDQQRLRLATVYPRLGLDRLKVALGFGGGEFTSEHPTSSELKSLLSSGFDPKAIWRTVVLALAPKPVRPKPVASGSWAERVQWVSDDPALRRQDFIDIDRRLHADGQRYLITFDGLDTLSQSWSDITTLMRGILQVGLSLRTSRAIRLKLFLRPDMADNPTLWEVGDSSKLRHDEVTLAWTRRDLHALLIQYLANHDQSRNAIGNYCERALKQSLFLKDARYEVPSGLVSSEEQQKALFTAIAGEFMGARTTMGRAYTWVPNHLANARGHAAPRSFLLALAVAAETARCTETALDVPGIQEGVRQASLSRLRELREDYRWIDAVFRPLSGMIVPTDRAEVMSRWREGKVIAVIKQEMKSDESGRYLPPPRLENGTDDSSPHAALLETLERLGIVESMSDGRINMPDLFRLAAKVRRKGGVKLRP